MYLFLVSFSFLSCSIALSGFLLACSDSFSSLILPDFLILHDSVAHIDGVNRVKWLSPSVLVSSGFDRSIKLWDI